MKIVLENITKSFKDNLVLKGISFTASGGRAFGLLGRNGSGKTTAIRIIMDIFKPDSGKVFFDGNYKIGYLPEERGLYPKRLVLDQMVYFGRLKGLSKPDARRAALSLLEKTETSGYARKKLETLSKGNQQKIQLAISLLNNPDVLILDEPFSGLDPINAKLLKSIVKERSRAGMIVFFSSHQMAEVEEFCDDVCIINNGTAALLGDLNAIKKSYPRDKIIFSSESPGFDDVLKDSKEIQSFEKTRNGYEVKLKNQNLKNDLLERLARDPAVELEAFRVAEPSLEDIFIEKAGKLDA
jgi:ABC-2 type transport system ATP-binding protein